MSLVQIETKALTGRKYWRSLNELSGTPAFREWMVNEFPGGAELLDGASRRNVLKLMAASFGLAGLAACRRPEGKIVPLSRGVEDLIPGKSYYYNTVFTQGGSAVGLTVEAHDGRPTKIEGNRNHPQSLGASNGYAQASVLNIYDPDRSAEVLKGGQVSSWAEWDQFASQKFTAGSLGRGAGLRIVSESVVSPSLSEVRKSLLAKYPEAKWVEYEPFSNENAIAGTRLVFGQPLQAHYHYDKADVVLSLDADFLGIDSGSPLSTKKFSKKRRSAKPEDEINRLYVVESQFSVTGAMADHRIRSKASDIDSFASALARELGILSELNVLGSADKVQKILMALVRDLKKNAGKSVVIAGPRQSARVHALALMINQALGNIGTTVTFTQPLASPEAKAFADLVGELNAGSVDTLVVLGSNPVFTAPVSLKFSDALKRAKTVVHLGAEKDETAVLSSWHLPLASYLESWGDARSVDGTVSIQQPLILPLNNGRSALELTAQIAGYKDQKGYEIVRNYWTSQWPAAEQEARFRKALHDGVLAGTAFAEVKVSADPKRVALPAATAKSTQVEVVFVPSWSVYDGRYTNNAWLQEAPDPMTKLVWDNAALISKATADKLKVVDGQILKITVGGQSLEIAAMVQPGQADDSITIAAGFGRKQIGRVGQGTGFNAFEIRVSGDAIQFASDVSNTGKTYQLVTTQEFHSMTEPKLMDAIEPKTRPIVREATVEEYRHHPDFAPHMVHAPDDSIYGWFDYSEGNQWGMTIDLNSCIGCNACIIACQSENNVPVIGKEEVSYGRSMHWIRLDRYYTGDAEDPQAVIQPLSCQQCEAAPCESVCPVAATTHTPEGLNDMTYNRCVGTRYCANNCPYKVRRFNFLNYHKEMVDIEKMVSNPNVSVRMRGVMEKCTYCVQRIQEAKIKAKVEGRRGELLKDGDITTACQQVCAADAIVFGNINDPESRVSQEKKQPRNYALLAEVNTRPRTTYLAKLRNPNPELVEHHG